MINIKLRIVFFFAFVLFISGCRENIARENDNVIGVDDVEYWSLKFTNLVHQSCNQSINTSDEFLQKLFSFLFESKLEKNDIGVAIGEVDRKGKSFTVYIYIKENESEIARFLVFYDDDALKWSTVEVYSQSF